jgi:hypothetical protein
MNSMNGSLQEFHVSIVIVYTIPIILCPDFFDIGVTSKIRRLQHEHLDDDVIEVIMEETFEARKAWIWSVPTDSNHLCKLPAIERHLVMPRKYLILYQYNNLRSPYLTAV